jgi:hypothetical protein
MKLTAPLVLALLCTVCSCQRELSELNPNTVNPANPTPSTASSGRLVAVYSRDSTLPAGSDTTAIARITYDGSGRVLTFTNSDKQQGGDSLHFRYVYSGSDTLASSIISYERTTGPYADVRMDTSWLEYANGRLMADSVTSNTQLNPQPFYQVRRFAYSGNAVFLYRYNLFTPRPSATDTAIAGQRYTVTRTNGDITSQQDDSAYYNPQTGALRTISNIGQFTATYDTRPNPFFQAGRSFQIPFVDVEYFIELLTDGSITRHLPLSSTHVNSAYVPTGSVTQSHNYTFGTDGLPTKRVTTFQQGGSTYTDTIYYLYQ